MNTLPGTDTKLSDKEAALAATAGDAIADKFEQLHDGSQLPRSRVEFAGILGIAFALGRESSNRVAPPEDSAHGQSLTMMGAALFDGVALALAADNASPMALRELAQWADDAQIVLRAIVAPDDSDAVDAAEEVCTVRGWRDRRQAGKKLKAAVSLHS